MASEPYPYANTAAAAFHDQVLRLIWTPFPRCRFGSPPAVRLSCQLGQRDLSSPSGIVERSHQSPTKGMYLIRVLYVD